MMDRLYGLTRNIGGTAVLRKQGAVQIRKGRMPSMQMI